MRPAALSGDQSGVPVPVRQPSGEKLAAAWDGAARLSEDTVPGGRSGYSGPRRTPRAALARVTAKAMARVMAEAGLPGYLSRDSSETAPENPAPRSSGFGAGYSRPTPRCTAGLRPGCRRSETVPARRYRGTQGVCGRGLGSSLYRRSDRRIQFDKVGVKKTMANFAPLTKLTTEE